MKNQTVVLENRQGFQKEISIWVDCPPLVIRRPRFDNVADVRKPLDEDVYHRVGVTESGLELFRQEPKIDKSDPDTMFEKSVQCETTIREFLGLRVVLGLDIQADKTQGLLISGDQVTPIEFVNYEKEK